MANKRISDLSELTVPTGNSVLPLVHQGATRKITLDNLFTYVDTNYFKSGKAPNATDNQGYTYNQFKNISGNFIISGSQMARVSTGIFQVDNTGLFKNYFSGKNCDIDNLSLQTGTLQEVNIKNLTMTGNVSSLNITGNLVNITGQMNLNSGIKIINSSHLNPLSFGQTPKIYATGNGSDLAIFADTTYIAKNLVVQEVATFKNNFSVTGNQINFYGNIVLGADQSHTVQLNGGWVGDIKPANDWLNEADSIFYDLGNPVARWRNVYAGRGIFHDSITLSGKLNVSGDTNISGRTTIGKDSSDTLRINATSIFTAPKVYIQNDLEVSGAEVIARNLVYNTGNQTISGIKTFDLIPIVSGNPLITGNLSLYATTVNLASTGSNLTNNISALSGLFTGYTGNLDSTYATDLQLANTGSTLVSSINSLSGTLTSNYATITNLISTGSTLDGKINNLSGYVSGISLGGSLPTIFVYTTGAQTISGNKDFGSRPTVNGTGVLLSGEAAQVDLTSTIRTTGDQNISGLKTFTDTGAFNNIQINNKLVTSYNYVTGGIFYFDNSSFSIINSSLSTTGILPSNITSGINYYVKNLNTGILTITGSGQRTIDGFLEIDLYQNDSVNLLGINNIGYTGWISTIANGGVS
jgi:hypothetical protein